MSIHKGHSMIDLTPALIVYEVCSMLLNDDGDEIETFDNEYVTCLESHQYSIEDIILKSEISIPDSPCKVQVYVARAGTLTFDRQGKLDVYDIDTSTGCNGSPIYDEVV